MLLPITSSRLKHGKPLSHTNALASALIALITTCISSKVNLILDLGSNAAGNLPPVPPATSIVFLLINLLLLRKNRQVLRVVSTFLSLLLLVQPL